MSKISKTIKISLHWSFVVLGLLMLVFGRFIPFACCVASVLLHEYGHAVVGKKLGYQLNKISLMPYGAMLSGKNAVFKPKDDIKIAVAGPVVNVILSVFSVLMLKLLPVTKDVFVEFLWANIFTFCFNMLPIYPLDGGRILSGTLSCKMPRIKALKITKIVGYILTCIVFVLFFVSFFFELNYMLGINALFLLIGLFEEDTSPYYEKISNLHTPKGFLLKSIKLPKSTPIFVAYKQIANSNISNIKIMDNGSVVGSVSSKKLFDSVLKLPIDTKIENIKD